MNRTRNLFIGLLAGALIVLMAACTTTGGTQQLPTPAELAAKACPTVKVVLITLATPGAMEPEAAAKVAELQPIVDQACAAGAEVTALDVKTLSYTVLPAVLKLISESSLSQGDKQNATIAVAVAQAIIATAYP